MTGWNLAGWDMNKGDEVEWQPWGSPGSDARARILGSGDGYYLCLIEAGAGYKGDWHEHTHVEMFYLISGRIRNQGVELEAGSGYAAAAGSVHEDFECLTPATYLSIFKL
ncbi:MAG: cupin domain-containing protein [Catenulispora sp.]|nr:cupin domain-containing protein [Catenulispora sp.]